MNESLKKKQYTKNAQKYHSMHICRNTWMNVRINLGRNTWGKPRKKSLKESQKKNNPGRIPDGTSRVIHERTRKESWQRSLKESPEKSMKEFWKVSLVNAKRYLWRLFMNIIPKGKPRLRIVRTRGRCECGALRGTNEMSNILFLRFRKVLE